MLGHYITHINRVLDRIVSHPDMIGSFSSGCHPVPLKKHGAYISLEKHTLFDSKNLGFDKSNESIKFVAWHCRHL